MDLKYLIQRVMKNLIEKNILINDNLVYEISSYIQSNFKKNLDENVLIENCTSFIIEQENNSNNKNNQDNKNNINKSENNNISNIKNNNNSTNNNSINNNTNENEENVSEIKNKYNYKVEIVKNYDKKPKKINVSTYIKYFKKRYNQIRKLLLVRPELSAVTSLSKIKMKSEKEEVSIIAMISNISETKNGYLIITVDDETDTIKLIINKNNDKFKNLINELALDTVIGVVGTYSGEDVIFPKNVILPEIPQTKEYIKAPDEVYACFLSDIHVGSKQFLAEKFERFLKWINGEIGDDKQKDIVKKIKYVFIMGDLVDGVGIYPGQDKDLDIKNIYEQYKLCFNYLDKIPKDKAIILTVGNHDAERLAEPQPALKEKYRQGADFSNFFFVSNPSLVKIHHDENFSGFLCLLYHGYSFDYYVANVNDIRNNGGYDRADLIMTFLLKRRHLAPSYTSTLYEIDPDSDFLVIDEIPDFFLTGHIHKTSVSNYKNITLISGSTWQDKTDFQEKLGHNPEPCRVPLVNLQTRSVKILKF